MDAPPNFEKPTCRCGQVGSFHCRECLAFGLLCSVCIVSDHLLLPLHQVEVSIASLHGTF